MPETRLFEDKYFGAERFDRDKGQRFHVVSVAGLLNADYRIPSIDYLAIFQLSAYLSHSEPELWKIYSLMVFNYLIGNKDDHAKNFAFIYKENEWSFTPAYDILPGEGLMGYHSTSINNKSKAEKEDLIELAKKAGLDEKKAKERFAEMNELCSEAQ